jgi:C-terminal processing protease CtpA/Prc
MLNRSGRLALVVFGLLVWARASAADERIDRLARLARLWGEVRYLHPWIYTKDIDWDAALIATIPVASRASAPAEERAALQSMLAALHDPVTRMEAPSNATAPSYATASASGASGWEWVEKGVLSVRLSRLAGFDELEREVAALENESARAKGIILDVRAQPPWRVGFEDVGDELDALAPLFWPRAAGATERQLLHVGYRTQVPLFGMSFSTALVEPLLPPAEPPAGGPGIASDVAAPAEPRALKVALIADPTSPLPASAIALGGSDDGILIAQGRLDDSYFTRTRTVALGAGLAARIRVAEFVPGLRPDVVLPAGSAAPRDAAFRAALAFVTGKGGADARLRKGKNAERGPVPRFRYDRTYRETPFPALEYRVLGLFRFWNVIHFFYPYLDLLDEKWDDVLAEMIPRFERAQNEREYVLAVRGLAAKVQDTHVGVFGTPGATAVFGAATFPLQFQMIDGQPVVTEVLDEETKKAGLAPGDVLVAVDGEKIADRARSLEKYMSASTALGLATAAYRNALRGPAGSSATLTVLGADGTNRRVTLSRGKGFYPPSLKKDEIVQVLEGNVGVVDLARLERTQVSAMFDKVMGTRALVFDLRRYPEHTLWTTVVPRLNRKGALYGVLTHEPVVAGAVTEEEKRTSRESFQALPANDEPKYQGAVLVLIDENTISRGEHAALFFESACEVTFVGSSTAGTDGTVTATTLPGGLQVSFTGDDERHADGRRLQRVGMKPDVPVRPTIAGIRAGRDEVLERALSRAREPGSSIRK